MATSNSFFTRTPLPSLNNHPSHRGTSVAASSNTWWTPLFGWSSDPDYIHTSTTRSLIPDQDSVGSDADKPVKSRFQPGCFTEEKAKQLRLKTMESANFHDIMYHSAIASRLASDVSHRNST